MLSEGFTSNRSSGLSVKDMHCEQKLSERIHAKNLYETSTLPQI